MIQNKLILDIKLQNRQIMLEPSLAEARAYWYNQLHKTVQEVCGLKRVEMSGHEPGDRSFKGLLLKMGEKDESFNIKQAYAALETVFAEALSYYENWKSY
jgi:hypothetical protein